MIFVCYMVYYISNTLHERFVNSNRSAPDLNLPCQLSSSCPRRASCTWSTNSW